MALIIDYLSNIMFYKTLKFITPRAEIPLHVSGAGIQEVMQPCIIDRPRGTGDRLMMFFYDPVLIRVGDTVREYPPNTLMLWKDSSAHYYGTLKSRWNHSWIHFHGPAAERMLGENGFVSDMAITFSRPDVMEEYLLKIYKELTGAYQPDSIILENLFHCMLREMKRTLDETAVPVIPERIFRVKSFIEKNPAKKLTLHRLASLAGLSVPHFCAEFKKCLAVSPVEYQLRLRFELAKYLLGNRNLNITEIAGQTGCGDIFQFSKMFRKRAGQSPSDFRSGLFRNR